MKRVYELDIDYPSTLQGGESLSDFMTNCNRFLDKGAIAEHVKKSLACDGIIILKNTGITSANDVEGWADIWAGQTMSYAGGTNKRQTFGKTVMTVGNEPPHVNVAAHNEMSYAYYDVYPRFFMLGCVQAPNKGGETIFANNIGITADLLKTNIGQEFFQHGVRYVRNYYNRDDADQAQYGLHSWQDAFDTDDRDIVTQKLAAHNIDQIEWRDNGALYFSYLRPAFEWDEDLKQNLSFISIGNHGYWFRGWKPYDTLPNNMRPHHLMLGNGRELSENEIQDIVELTVKHSLEHVWEDGDLVILDNLRYTHARRPFVLDPNDKREIYVSMRVKTKRTGIVQEEANENGAI